MTIIAPCVQIVRSSVRSADMIEVDSSSSVRGGSRCEIDVDRIRIMCEQAFSATQNAIVHLDTF